MPKKKLTLLCIDTESNTYNKGNPFDRRFTPVCIGYRTEEEHGCIRDRRHLAGFSELLAKSETLIGFNLKYDLHVLRKWGLAPLWRKVWDCQVAEYILDRQQNAYPSLEGTARKYGIQGKFTEVAEYWDKGVQTDEIPLEILDKYVKQDVDVTYQIFLEQQKLIQPHHRSLLRLAMLDLLCLEEMEWHGIKYDRSGIEEKSKQIETEISELQSRLNLFHSVPNFNWNSSDHLSALLFGGTILQEVKVPAGYYKTGKKAGEVKYKKELVEHHLPRLFKPVNKTETGKNSTDEDALLKLGDSELVKSILKIKELQKLNSTYFGGLLSTLDKFNFEPGWIHGNFNQCVTRTGRLSSSKPNLQNAPEDLDAFLVSRF